MRIRKNIKKLSSLGLLLLLPKDSDEDNDLGSTHFVCQLNQSPWDVIPFFSSSSSSYTHQGFVSVDSISVLGRLLLFTAALNCCGFVGSVRPIERCANESYFSSDEKLIVGFGNEGPHKIVETDGESSRPVVKIECAKTGGEFWKCKRKVKEGHHFCEHHILQLKSYGRGGVGNSENPGKANGTGPGRARATRKKKSEPSSSSGSNQYYYYSGFGPLWGKKQGESPPGRDSAVARDMIEGINYLNFGDGLGDGDDKDGATRGEGSKKRVRKPIKARSLKSLM